MFKILILLSGNGSNFQAIYDRIEANHWPIEILTVISDKAEAFGIKRAQQCHIPSKVIAPEDYENKEAWTKALLSSLREYAPDLIVLAGFMRILPAEIVSAFQNKIINIHPSILPNYKGLNTHQRVLDAKEKKHGCSIHIVTNKLDDGRILGQLTCDIDENETVESLEKKVHALEHQLYPEVIYAISCAKIKLSP